MRIFPAVDDVEIAHGLIVSDRIRIHFELDCLQQAIGFAVEDFHRACATIGDVYAVAALAENNGVRNLHALNAMKLHAGFEIQDKHFMHRFSSQEETAALQVNTEMIKAAFHFCRQFETVDEAKGFR